MQLTYSGFLWGLLAVGVPVVIHLLQLRRPQRVLFTNTGFIREVELVTTRQRKLQHLLILFVRVLGVVALVLMFCQPFVPAREDGRGQAGVVNVLVDSSPSMQVRGSGEQVLWGAAVGGARTLSKGYPATTRFRLVGKGATGLTQAGYGAALDEMRLTGRGGVLEKLGNASRSSGEAGPLYVFSDFQKNAFDAKQLEQVEAGREVVLVPEVGTATGNVYVDSVWIDDAFVRVRTNVGLHIRLRNGGGAVATDCPVKVFLNVRQVAAFRVTVGVGQVVTSVVQVQVAEARLAQGRVVTEDAPVTFDNTYYFTLQPAAAIRVVEIGAEPVAQGLYGDEPLFSYSFAKPQNVDYGQLRTANLVLVREVAQVDAGLREALAGVTKRGGSVVVIPSALMAGRDSYQQLFKALGTGMAQWEALATPPELREVAMPNTQEPFFRDVFGAQQRAVTMPRVAPVLRWARTGTDIMRLRDGESYLAEFGSGAGKVYVFSAPFAREYSDFTSHALFVPVLYRLAMLSYRDEQLPAYRLTQGTVALTLPTPTPGTGAAADRAAFRLVKDSVTLIPAQRVQGPEVRLDVPATLDAPGFYQVQRDGKTLTTLAFNADKKESELAAYSAEELRALIGPNRPNIRVVEAGAGGAGLATLRAAQTGQPLWRYCLLAALLCLLAEGLLLRFGGQRRAAARVAVA